MFSVVSLTSDTLGLCHSQEVPGPLPSQSTWWTFSSIGKKITGLSTPADLTVARVSSNDRLKSGSLTVSAGRIS